VPEIEQGLDVRGTDPALGDLDRGLDHGEHEVLYAVAVESDVALFDREQAGLQCRQVEPDVAAQQGAEPFLRHGEDCLVVPERVVAVERDDTGRQYGFWDRGWTLRLD